MENKADKAIKDTRKYLTKAIESLSNIVIHNVVGTEEYKEVRLIKFQELLFNLLNSKRILEE